MSFDIPAVCSLIDQFSGPQQLKGQIFPETFFSADAHGLLTTTPLQLIHAHRDVAQLVNFTDTLTEPTGYIGLPLLLLAVGALVALRKDRRIRTALLMAHARGVLLLAGAQAGIPVHSFMPNEVKQVVAGNGHACAVCRRQRPGPAERRRCCR